MMKFIATLLSVVLAAPAAFAQESADWDRALPDDTVGVVRCGVRDFAGGFRKTGLGKIVLSPELKAFFGSIKSDAGGFEEFAAGFGTFVEKTGAALGGGLESGLDGVAMFQLILLAPGQQGAAPIVVVAAELKKPEIEAALLKYLKEELFKGQAEEMATVEGVEVARFGPNGFVAKIGGSLVLASEEAGIARLARNFAKAPERSLASSERYKHARKTVEPAANGLFVYVDMVAVRRMLPPGQGGQDPAMMLGMIGLQAGQYIAVSVEPEGDAFLQKVHANTDLAAPAGASPREMLDLSVSELAKRPGAVNVQLTHIKAGELAKRLFDRARPHFPALAEQFRKNGVEIDLAKFPMDLVAAGVGEGQEVTLADGRGVTMVTRSNAGFTSTIGVAQVAIISAIAIPGLMSSQRASGERNAAACLKTLASAEADFRANDRDMNREIDFWVGDVAGLYTLVPAGEELPMKLIELSMAGADAAPVDAAALAKCTQPAPKAGYFFRAMTHDNSGGTSEAYEEKPGSHRNSSRFGFCAYPAQYGSSGRMTYILNEGNVVYRKDTHGEPVLAWPTDAELNAEWNKMD